MKELDMKSPNLVEGNIEYISSRFPNCITEGPNGRTIDFDLLKQELSSEVIEGNKERYRLEWPGKKEAIVTANLPTTKTLRPVRGDSVDFDNTENIYIEGDNLEVLKILQESYLGKIKMIYIDPPYNTGNDFVYKDDFKQSTEDYKEDSGQLDEYDQRLFVNPETSGRYHSDWLSMIYPRLKLARNLLSDKGLIFISIDDNELQNLKCVCDQVFGEINFISNIIWEKRFTRSNNAKRFYNLTENILCYRKNELLDIIKEPRSQKANSNYSNPDNDDRGPWTTSSYVNPATKEERPNLVYEIERPDSTETVKHITHAWKYEYSKYLSHKADNRLYWGLNKEHKYPRLKLFLSEMDNGMVPVNLWKREDVGTTDEAGKSLEELFGSKIFDFPKPIGLLKKAINLNCTNGDIVLDFFSGSGTLSEAIFSINHERKTHLKFIMVQLPEIVGLTKTASMAGFKNICEIGKERIRRAAKKIKEETNADIDYGFRVYRLDDSNMQDVYYTPQDYEQQNLELFADNVKPDRTAEDLLTQVILDWGLPLSLKIEKVDIEGKEVFKVAGNSLYACFDSGVDEAFAKAIAKQKPLRIVFKDASFKDDTAKSNVKQLLKQLSPETEMRVI